MKILIVDDDKFLVDMYSMKFSENGYDVVAAQTGDEAVEKIETGLLPNVCLVDIVMPGMDGFEVVRRITEKLGDKKGAIIFLSNLGQKEDVEKGLGIGAGGYIVKASATPSEVVSKVKEILANKMYK